jgi:hypothetical protein
MALSIEQLTFAKWLCTPAHQRQPESQKELAAVLKVAPQTLSEWKNLPEFELALSASALQWGAKQLPGVVQSLFRYANEPNGSADRATIVRYFLPGLAKLREENFFEILTPAAHRLPAASAEQLFMDLTEEERVKFLALAQKLQLLDSGDQAVNFYQVEKDDEGQPPPPIPRRSNRRARRIRPNFEAVETGEVEDFGE